LRQAGPEDAEIVFQRTQIGARLRRAIETLPVEQDEALAETFLSDISYDEYPTRDELPLGTVKSRLRLDLEGAS
jgi:DNA-directed RNA polymerase specialized sigma24 family protein